MNGYIAGKAGIQRQYLNEQIADMIKSRIIEMDYIPGQRLIVEAIANEIETSTTPVREGLRELVLEGLISYDGKGYQVFNPSKKEMIDIFALRSSLEKLAVGQAAAAMHTDEIRQLIADYDRISGDGHLSDGMAMINADIFFHTEIMKRADCCRLNTMLRPLQEQCWLIRRWVLAADYSETVVQNTHSEHRLIMEALLEHSPVTAELQMGHHLKNGKRVNMESLESFWNEADDSSILSLKFAADLIELRISC